MIWTYRVFRDGEGEYAEYSIRHVYYNEETREIEQWCSGNTVPEGTTLEELRTDLEQMLAALDKPVLHEELREDTNGTD